MDPQKSIPQQSSHTWKYAAAHRELPSTWKVQVSTQAPYTVLHNQF